jgi:DNA (cytosine-5)-methyltransferase 1
MSLTLVSLFDGIGGFPLAFSGAGARTVATVEIDKAAASVAGRHFPDATHFDDVTKVTADDLRSAGFVPDRGIVTAGWPCQDFSVAGRRAGLVGARSGLWWEVVRILADIRPRWFIGENVPGLLSSVCTPECDGGCMAAHGGAMGAVLGSLAELGYGHAYRVLDAQFFGVPQQRRRVVIVGHLGAPFGAAAQVLLEPESGTGDLATGRQARTNTAGPTTAGARTAGRDVAPALVARYAKGTDSDATDALIIDTHTHTQELRSPHSRVAGNGATGSTPSRQRVAISSFTRGGRSVDE